MTDRDALMATILAHPDDDLARLVFADYLDETGEEAGAAHAELIRVQCELAKTGKYCHPNGPGRQTCGQCHAIANLKTVESGHFVPFSPFAVKNTQFFRSLDGVMSISCHPYRDYRPYSESIPPTAFYRRGFINAVICDGPTWLDHGVELAKQQPIEFVTLTTELPLMIDGPHWSDHRNAAERRWELRSSWNVRRTDTTNRYGTGWESERLAMQSIISDHDILSGKRGEEFLARSVDFFRQECRANATIEGYLRLKWPKVKFTRMGEHPPGRGYVLGDRVYHNDVLWVWSGRWEREGNSPEQLASSFRIPTWEEYQQRDRPYYWPPTSQIDYQFASPRTDFLTQPTASWNQDGGDPIGDLRRVRDEILRQSIRPPEPPFVHDPV